MIVTTGGRGSKASSVSTSVSIARSMSESLTRVMLCPNSVTSSSAVSWSIDALIVTGMPILNSAFTRSAPFSAMRLASSWTVIDLGHDDVADLLGLRLARAAHAAMFLLARPLERGERPCARTVTVAQRAVDGELARLCGGRRPCGRAAAAARGCRPHASAQRRRPLHSHRPRRCRRQQEKRAPKRERELRLRRQAWAPAADARAVRPA